jgi:hypothetical protein
VISLDHDILCDTSSDWLTSFVIQDNCPKINPVLAGWWFVAETETNRQPKLRDMYDFVRTLA